VRPWPLSIQWSAALSVDQPQHIGRPSFGFNYKKVRYIALQCVTSRYDYVKHWGFLALQTPLQPDQRGKAATEENGRSRIEDRKTTNEGGFVALEPNGGGKLRRFRFSAFPLFAFSYSYGPTLNELRKRFCFRETKKCDF